MMHERVVWRLYVSVPNDDKSLGELVNLTPQHLPHATVYSAAGVWGGRVEQAVVIEVVANDAIEPRVRNYGALLLARFNQKVYMLTRTVANVDFVSAKKGVLP